MKGHYKGGGKDSCCLGVAKTTRYLGTHQTVWGVVDELMNLNLTHRAALPRWPQDMNMAFASMMLYLPISNKPGLIMKSFTSNHDSTTTKKTFHCLATVATTTGTTRPPDFEVENKKHDLLKAIQDTQRGAITTADQRSFIEEALVSVEGYDAGLPIDLVKLDGTWRLQYTSAPDVLILLESAIRLPFFQIGQIFQKFECRNKSDGGVVRNVVRWSVPAILEEQEGATLNVSAKFTVVSVRNIYLQFEEISFQNIYINESLQALISPAMLPRSFLSLQILQFIRSFKAQIPVRSPGDGRKSVGGLYYLSYLDNNMLLGRAVGGGGVFVFTKAQPLD